MNKKSSVRDEEAKWDKTKGMYVPKGALLAYMQFRMDRTQEYQKKNNEDGKGNKLSAKQIVRKIRSEWLHLEEEAKNHYLKQNERARERYNKQMEEMQKNGYFHLSDGTKSNQLDAPKEEAKKRKSMTPAKQSKAKRQATKKK